MNIKERRKQSQIVAMAIGIKSHITNVRNANNPSPSQKVNSPQPSTIFHFKLADKCPTLTFAAEIEKGLI
jgi:hypothetical protein